MSNSSIGAKDYAYMEKFLKNYRITYLHLVEHRKVNMHIIQ